MPYQPHPERPPRRLTEVTPETIFQNGQFLKRAKVGKGGGGGGGGAGCGRAGQQKPCGDVTVQTSGDTVRFVHR